MTKPVLKLANVAVVVNQGTTAAKSILKPFDLTINQGEFVTILGTNGAGKSTLLNVINGQLPVTQGTVKINDQVVTKLSQAQRATQIAQVFQDPKQGTAPRMTVAENLLLAQRRGHKRGLRFRRLKNQLPQLQDLVAQFPNGLADRLMTPAGDLSGGQRQTLSFLMATMQRPTLLLLDEHTAALDPKTSQQLMTLTEQVVKEQGLTCLMITHQLKDALRYGNRLIILKDGQIALDCHGDQKQALTERELLQYFVD